MYAAAVIVFGVGVTYASVPLYRLFCAATGFGGTPLTSATHFGKERLVPVDEEDEEGRKARRIRVTFNADCSDALPWKFSPRQREVRVLPGETCLAFYTAENRGEQDLIGIATYNVTPDKVS
jgi:cytochrome c oxidase assembly protein subunit 11